ncbi:uncharacterized protein LOC119068415 isoform X1 [Bradysia coprophila]|uniref:uncharacterized protein LOC119068415 isoform X1 n=2 Tax=Bradysia coprophila TaxID=38358 RepID=UPI00187D9E9E|nr:uncharacterized protein LOC119068415 isoform X1 [Bradysia coprophila]
MTFSFSVEHSLTVWEGFLHCNRISIMSDTEDDSSISDNSWPVNEAWLIGILTESHKCSETDIKILNFDVKTACQNGVSNLSDLLAVSVKYEFVNASKSKDLIIKLLPHDPFSRFFVTEAQFDLREIKFYTNILPQLIEFQRKHLEPNAEAMVISVPTCFHTQYTAGNLHTNHTNDDMSPPEPPESILVLEDLRPMGYRSAHFKKGLTLVEAEAAVTTIAVVHALSLGMKVKEKVNLNERYPFLFQTSKATESYQQLVEQGLPQLSKFLERITGHEKELGALTAIRPKTRSIIENLLQPVEPMGLITHTDFWCNNLLLRETIDATRNDNCVILDWQMVTYSRPTNDIALLIISSLPSKVRRENTGKLLNLYYTSLKNNLEKISVDLEVDLNYSRHKLEQDYKKSQLLALLLCIGSVDIALGNKDAEQRFLDVLHDLYEEGILNTSEISI